MNTTGLSRLKTIFIQVPKTKFHEIRAGDALKHADRRTDTTRLTGAFRDNANAPTNGGKTTEHFTRNYKQNSKPTFLKHLLIVLL
jgi:hypothetical protein